MNVRRRLSSSKTKRARSKDNKTCEYRALYHSALLLLSPFSLCLSLSLSLCLSLSLSFPVRTIRSIHHCQTQDKNIRHEDLGSSMAARATWARTTATPLTRAFALGVMQYSEGSPSRPNTAHKVSRTPPPAAKKYSSLTPKLRARSPPCQLLP